MERYPFEIDAKCTMSSNYTDLLHRRSYLVNILEERYNQHEIRWILKTYKPLDIAKFEKLKMYRERQLIETEHMLGIIETI